MIGFTSHRRNEIDVTQFPTFRRPRWRDPRLGVGILLVAISVALGSWVFSKADHTSPVYRAGGTVPVSERLVDAQLELVNVNLADAHEAYLTPADVDDLTAAGHAPLFVRAVPAGELIPRSAIGTSADLELRPLSVVVTNPGPVHVGSVVDLWVTPEGVTGQEETEPELVASGLHVSAIEEDDSLFAAARGNVVQVLVPQAEVGTVLAALGSRAQVTLVPQLGG